MTPRDPAVSVILVNFRGVADTVVAARAVEALTTDESPVEVVIVDNGSGDGSLERLRQELPFARVIGAGANLGFAGGCNLGVEHARAPLLAFLNNDARPGAGWISAALARFDQDPRIAAVASKVVDWDGERIDFVDAALTWFGMGYKPGTGELLGSVDEAEGDVLFGTGSGMFVRSEIYRSLGGFDEDFFMFFEDVDFGWRLNLAGYRFVYETGSLVFHKHHASMSDYASFREQLLLERNALFTLYKNLSDERLYETLTGAMLLSARRSSTLAAADSREFDITRAGNESRHAEVDRALLVTTYAMEQFLDALPTLTLKRTEIQAARRRSDAKIAMLAGLTDVPVLDDPRFVEGYETILSALEVGREPRVPSVLIITGDPLGERMAGPAIRAWNIADALAQVADVTLVTLSGGERPTSAFATRHVEPARPGSISDLVSRSDVIIFQGHALDLFPEIARSKAIVVADVYDPMHFEQLEQARSENFTSWASAVADATHSLNAQLARADYVICASERQRNLYLGQLAAIGRINASNYKADRTLRRLIDVVPFGIPADDPVKTRPVLKGVVEGIPVDEPLVIWSGGIYEWFDPITLVESIALLAERGRRVHLFFQGTMHPHPGVPEMAVVQKTRDLAARLGLVGDLVHLNESWVPYNERAEYLLEAQAGVSTHFEHAETSFSFRTRILDYLWAGLPIVCTRGDHFAALVDSEGLGLTVPESNAVALADALEVVLFDEARRGEMIEAVRRVREQYRWARTLAPLLRFVASATPAADRSLNSVPFSRWGPRQAQRGWARDVIRALRLLRRGQLGPLVAKVRRRFNSRFG
jgi:GT2 family glycosyltransferase/glycosyltransferase involved in cell wall biosynthesis